MSAVVMTVTMKLERSWKEGFLMGEWHPGFQKSGESRVSKQWPRELGLDS